MVHILTVQEVAGSFCGFSNVTSVKLYDSPQQAVTNKLFTSISPSGNNIGSAQLRCVTLNNGTPGTNNATYLIHVFNLSLSNAAYSVSDIKSLYSSSPACVADILGFTQGVDNELFSFGINGIKTLNSPNQTEFVFKTFANSNLTTLGTIGVTVPSIAGGTDILPYGVGVVPNIDVSTFSVTVNANTDANSSYFTGTVTVYSTNNQILGSGTNFVTNFQPGDLIKINGSTIKTVVAVSNNTVMYVDSALAANASAQTYIKTYLAGKQLPIITNFAGPTAYVNVTSSQAFTIVTNEVPSASIPVTVTHNILRTSAYPGAKTINKNRFVVINIANNNGGPNGPWCLGFPDISLVKSVYAAASNNFTTSLPNVLGSGITLYLFLGQSNMMIYHLY